MKKHQAFALSLMLLALTLFGMALESNAQDVRPIVSGFGTVLDIREARLGDLTPVQVWDYLVGANQRWYLVYKGAGYHEIRSLLNHKCLDIRDANKNDGAIVQMFTCNGQDNQRWYPDYSRSPQY